MFAIALGTAPAGATVPADLCTGNPCNVVGADNEVEPGSVLDFGAGVDLVIKAAASVKVGEDTEFPREITLRARSITIESNGRILGEGDDAIVNLDATGGNITMIGPGARIDLRSEVGGTADLTATGNIAIGGEIDASGTGLDSTGGAIILAAQGSITTTGDLKAGGTGGESVSGDIIVDAGTGLTIGGTVDASAGTDGGFIGLSTTTSNIAINGKITGDGGSPDGLGSEISIEATNGDVTVSQQIVANGASGPDGDCGDGGELTIEGRKITLAANITLNGGKDCFGGTFEAIASDSFTQSSGTMTLEAAGGFGGGGVFTVDAFGEAVVRNVAMAASSGGIADIRSRSSQTTIDGFVNVRGANSAFDFPGIVTAIGCTVRVTPNGKIDARGDEDFPGIGVVILEAHTASLTNAIVVEKQLSPLKSGEVRALTQNEFRLRAGAPTINGIVDPAPTITLDPNLTPCASAAICGNGAIDAGEACDDAAATGTPASCCAAGCGSIKPNGTSCDDGVFCNGADSCASAACTTHAGDPCTGASGSCASTTCSESLLCNKPAGTVCPDGDGNVCTDGACNDEGTCLATPKEGECPDGDGNACTDGACDDQGACVPTPKAGSCDDGDANPCTDGVCDQGSCVAQPNEASCDDGTFCNGAEECVDGTCRRFQIACSENSCDENGEACEPYCGDGDAQPGETCGEPGTATCATGESCIDCACQPGGAPGDSYLCYNADDAPAPTWQFTPTTKTIRDRFETTKTFDVSGISRICSPAVVDAPQGVLPTNDPSVSEVDHAIALSTTPPQEPFVTSEHAYEDLFGTLQLVLRKPVSMMLRAKHKNFGPILTCDDPGDCTGGETCQSGVCLPDPAEPPPSTPRKNTAVFNYKCYQVKLKTGTTKFTKVKNVRVTDRLGVTMLYDLTKPARTCSPASVDGINAAAPNRPGQLTCYKVKPSVSTPAQAPVDPHEIGLRYVGFDPAFMNMVKATELCIPSLVDPAP